MKEFKFGSAVFHRVEQPCKKVVVNSITCVAVLSYTTTFEESTWAPLQSLHVIPSGPSDAPSYKVVTGVLGGTQYVQENWPAQVALDLAELLRGEPS